MSASGGFGVTFGIGDGPLSGTPTYGNIAQVTKWNGISSEAVMAEVTNHGSTGGREEFVPSGKFKTGEIELELAWDKTAATHTNASGGLLHAHLNKTLLAYKFTLPDAAYWVTDAYVSKFEHMSEQEDAIRAKVTLRPTGSLTPTTS